MNTISKTMASIQTVEEKFRKIQENPALYGAENGLTAEELELLERLIALIGEVGLAADAIIKRGSK